MKLQPLLAAVLAATANLASASASENDRVASIFIQPVSSPDTPPTLLAELAVPKIELTSSSSSSSASTTSSSTTPAEVLSYEAPDLSDSESQQQQPLLRIGVYDPTTKRWTSPTSVMSAANFAKGYAPHFVLSEGGDGSYLGVVCRGVAIDAGYTRDFGPQAVVVRTAAGAQPALGKPVVLNPEGRKVEEVGEKTFFQKYVYLSFVIIAGGDEDANVLLAGTGGHWLWVRFSCSRAEAIRNNRVAFMLGHVTSWFFTCLLIVTEGRSVSPSCCSFIFPLRDNLSAPVSTKNTIRALWSNFIDFHQLHAPRCKLRECSCTDLRQLVASGDHSWKFGSFVRAPQTNQ